jgi:flagellar export protein FliJ
MALFRYRLAPMLRVRENERDRYRIELAAAQREESRIAARISQLNDELTLLQRRIQQAAGPGPVDIERLRNAQRHQQQLKADLQQLEIKRREAEAEVDRRRQTLLEADRQVRTLEMHREQQLARYRLEEHKCETKRLDEFAIQSRASKAA